MPAACRPRFFLLTLGLMALLPGIGQAAPADLDYETISPAAHTNVTLPAVSSDPPGLADSPLMVPDHPIGPHPQMRFVMHDGTVLIGKVLAFDGQMYALWAAHSTMLVRKDLFVSITPFPTVSRGHTTAARSHPTHGTRGL